MPQRLPFRDAVAVQPHSLRLAFQATSESLDRADLSALRKGTIGLVGIGASLYAAVAAAAQFRSQGLPAYAFAGGELYDAESNPADAYIAVSASGRSVEPAKAAALRDPGITYGIAQDAVSPMASSVGQMIGTGSGADSGPNTTSYIGSLQALGLIADRVGKPSGYDWISLPDAFSSTLEGNSAAISRASQLLAGKRSIDCVGANTAYGAAGYAALLIREAVRVPAQNWDTLNFLHGPMEPNDSGTGVMVFGDGREVQLAQDLAGFGIATVLITSADVADMPNLVVVKLPKVSNGIASAVLAALPTQLIMQDLAEGAGMPVCAFRYRQTDTKLPELAEQA